MADTRIARPYAQAVFDTARKEGDLAGWSERLSLLAAVSEDASIQTMVASPRVTADQLADALNNVCGDKIGSYGQNLVRLLARNRRVSALPEIATQYEKLRAESEQMVEAELITAQEVSSDQISMLASALERKLGRSVKLQSRVDPSLMGGAIIRTGDLVIDGSVTTKLSKLNSQLSQ